MIPMPGTVEHGRCIRSTPENMRVLVLDAMGVIFKSAHIVADIIAPFIAAQGGLDDRRAIKSLYLDASLGNISADDFWTMAGLSPSLEDACLEGYQLSPGAMELLVDARTRQIPVWLLSNDVARWSQKLRRNFNLESYLAGAVISSTLGLRKPQKQIFEYLLASCGCAPGEVLYVDDKLQNVSAARELGFNGLLFGPANGMESIMSWLSQGET